MQVLLLKVHYFLRLALSEHAPFLPHLVEHVTLLVRLLQLLRQVTLLLLHVPRHVLRILLQIGRLLFELRHASVNLLVPLLLGCFLDHIRTLDAIVAFLHTREELLKAGRLS